MQVAQLIEFLRSLEGPLRAGGATKAAQDLASAAGALAPFGELALPELARLLQQAEAFLRDGTLPPPTKGRGKPAAAAAAPDVSTLIQEVRAFYDRVLQPEVGYSEIEAFVKQLDKQLKKDAAVEVARGFEIAHALKSKKDAIAAIRQRLVDRKQAYQRSDF